VYVRERSWIRRILILKTLKRFAFSYKSMFVGQKYGYCHIPDCKSSIYDFVIWQKNEQEMQLFEKNAIKPCFACKYNKKCAKYFQIII